MVLIDQDLMNQKKKKIPKKTRKKILFIECCHFIIIVIDNIVYPTKDITDKNGKNLLSKISDEWMLKIVF